MCRVSCAFAFAFARACPPREARSLPVPSAVPYLATLDIRLQTPLPSRAHPSVHPLSNPLITLWCRVSPENNTENKRLFLILDSKRRLGTFKVFVGLILLILFYFLMALFFNWKVDRVLMVVGLSSPLSKSSFILFYSWCFCTPKAR